MSELSGLIKRFLKDLDSRDRYLKSLTLEIDGTYPKVYHEYGLQNAHGCECEQHVRDHVNDVHGRGHDDHDHVSECVHDRENEFHVYVLIDLHACDHDDHDCGLHEI